MTTQALTWLPIIQAIGVGAIGAAIVAGIVALVGHLISKSNAELQAMAVTPKLG